MHETEYLIIGAGPTGLGAACRLAEHGRDFRIVEAEPHFGGLSASFVDAQGFTWDLGGHVLFSHYETFDRYMDLALGADGWFDHERESWVWIKDRFVPYPFQNNLHRLDPEDRWNCVRGLLEAAQNPAPRKPAHFGEWMVMSMGQGLTALFLRPYNFKVWAWPAEQMDYNWIGERVSVPRLEQVLKSICLNHDEVSWGPNRLFRFPKFGGTGAIWQAIGRRLDPARVSLGWRIERIDAGARTAQAADGQAFKYRKLISTIPLNRLIRITPGPVAPAAADQLLFSATHLVGAGIAGQPPDHLKTKCWMYFPQANSPYYRTTVFTNYSPNNAPRPGAQWSLMTEVAESPAKPVNRDTVVEECLRAFVEDRLLPDRGQVCSVAYKFLPQGYPTPFLGRDAVVDPALRRFEEAGIFSRGRFGAWKYEVANQDHSFAQGYECAERLLHDGGPEYEPTLFTPAVVNARRNP